MDGHELLKALEERAQELGWEIEYNWRDTSDGTEYYDLYAWRAEESK